MAVGYRFGSNGGIPRRDRLLIRARAEVRVLLPPLGDRLTGRTGLFESSNAGSYPAPRTMAYKTIYTDINQITFKEAWGKACQLDPTLKKIPMLTATEETLQEALVSLARRIAELEKELSV